MKRRVLVGLACLSLSVMLGCPEEPSAVDEGELTIVVEADTERLKAESKALAQRQQELTSQKEALLQERQAMIDRAAKTDDLQSLITQQKRLLERERELRAREQQIAEARSTLDAEQLRALGATGATAGATGGGAGAARGGDLARREGALASREADLARREKALAEREARLADREASAAKLVASAAVAAPSREPGRRVTRKEVERAHQQVRREIRQRGLLEADLSGDAAALQRRIYDASRAGRWEEARDAVDDLARAVTAIDIDEPFVQAKMARLNTLRRKTQLNAEDTGRVDGLLSEATVAFADGRHGAANARLNEIFAILKK